jgi:hypothetical protein
MRKKEGVCDEETKNENNSSVLIERSIPSKHWLFSAFHQAGIYFDRRESGGISYVFWDGILNPIEIPLI